MLDIHGNLVTFNRYRFLLGQLVSREIKIRYQRSVLGIAWSVLNPFLMMLILNVVFSKLFRMAIPNYLVYYLTGSLIFSFMSEATGGALQSIIGNAGLIKKVYIPKYIFPMAKTTSAMVNFGFSLIALAIVCVATGVNPGFAILAAVPLFALLYVFVLGLSLFFSSYTVFFRDIIHLHGILMMMWMYMTPIIYPEELLKGTYSLVLHVNPLYPFIRMFRGIILGATWPFASDWLSCFLMASASLVFGLVVFKRNQDRFILYF